MAIKLDETGRWDESGKKHAEDVILAGRALHVIGKVAKAIPKPTTSWGINDFMRHALGGMPAGRNPYTEHDELW
jgi:hypothetical protein